jgi:fibronectin type 3 domain-containing protein
MPLMAPLSGELPESGAGSRSNRRFGRMRAGLACLAAAAAGTFEAGAHPITFNSTISYAATQPSGGAASISNWSGAAFDAANIGGSGVNADGGADNGAANDASTYVANNQPIQGQTFTTGSNANGYEVSGITVRMAGYTDNTASGSNTSSWNLGASNGPIHATIARINGTTRSTVSIQNFMAGGTGNPGSGTSANGSGTYLTFNLPFPVHLEPNTTYGFDLIIGNGSGNHFEWLGTSTNPYGGGTAYTRSWSGPITPLSGDRVFQVNMTAATAPHAPFVHPGTLHTQADFDRMKAKIAAGIAPWKTSFDQFTGSRYAQTGWGPTAVEYINRGGTAHNNYTRSQMDAQAIYQLSLRWKLTGDEAYANQAVVLANAWSGKLLGITGDSNQSLAAGICGYLFATGGEILSTYPGWPAAEKQAYKDMMMRVFYPSNFDFLWRHHGTPVNKGGNTHYRLNWDTANMASMAAIGILCDNRAVYQQAVDFFKHGASNGRVERAAWFIHPDGTAQTEESGRDQPHNNGGWYAMGLLCQMAWNQGDDLFGYDNNRVLRAYEYNAKYNLGNDVPWVYHRNTTLAYTETLSGSGRSVWSYSAWELVYNHYANVKGVAAPWSKIAMNTVRPEGYPTLTSHPSAQDHLGLGSLTYARDNTSTSAAPGGLLAQWSKNQVILSWWGSATATSYQIQRAASAGGPYTTLGTAVEPNLNFTDDTVANGGSYYYKVVAVTPTGNLESVPLLVNQAVIASYSFEGNANDGAGTRHGTLKGTVLPGYAAGFGGGQAISLNGTDQYVQLPVNSGLSRDVTLAAWVYWNGGNNWQRVFDFGSEIEKYMMLTVKGSTGKITFQMTTSRATDGTITLTGPAMPTATWTHLAVTFNGETATLYVNGLPVASGSSSRLSPMFSQTFCYLGRSMWNNDPYFNGRIDDFRIHNHALSGSDVYGLWGQSANHAPEFSADPIALPSATEDADYGALALTLATWASDADGGALAFAKVSGPAWLNVAPNGVLSGMPSNNDVGVNRFIVRVTDASGATDDAILTIPVTNTNDAPTWLADPIVKPSVTRGQPYLAVSLAADAVDVDSGATLTFGKSGGPTWLNVAADGTLSGTPAAGDVGTNTFTVLVTDDTGLSDEATLAVEVLPFGMRAHLAFEDNTADILGNFPGTASGSPAYATGRIGHGIVLDGVDDHVALPAAIADSQDISIAAWVLWNGGGANQRVFDFGNNTSQYLFLSPNSGGLRFAIKDGEAEQQVTSAALPTGQWVHVVVTLGANTATLYVNGSVTGTNNAITIHPGDFKPAWNYIGKSQWPDPLFNGRIDGFRVYNHAITPAEIAVLMDEVPAVPMGATATPKMGRIDLAWAASQGAQSYTVKRSLTNGGSYSVIASGLTTAAYADTGLTNGTSYYYVLSATNAKGESADSAQVTAVPSDLLAWLKFDETSGATAADSSGNGWHATLVNSPAWTPGLFNGCIDLPATANQALTLPTGIVSGLGDFTISGWVKVGAFGTFSRIFDFGTGTTNYMFLTPQYTATAPNAAKFRFAIRTPATGEQQLTSSTAVSAGTWVHYAVTLSGTTGRMYLNGGLVATNTGMTLQPSSLGSTNLNFLGDSQFGPDPIFNGQLDDFRIHSRALSAAEILAASAPQPEAPTALGAQAGDATVTLNWNAAGFATTYHVKRATSSGGSYTTVGSGITAATFTDTAVVNEVAYYYIVTAVNAQGESAASNIAEATPSALRVHLKFDESAGSGVTDSSGRGWHGTTVNEPVWEAGNSGNALKLAGASSQHVTLPAGIVNGVPEITISTWVKTSSLATWQRIFDFGTGTGNYMFLTTQHGTGGNANKLRFAIRTPAVGEEVINSSVTTPAGTWAHVAVVLSGATGRLYLDGLEVGVNAGMTLNPASLGATTQNYLGKSQWPDPYLDASLDDFRIYSRALNAEEVSVLASPLEAPQELVATAGFQEVQLAWDAVPNAASYTVKSSVTSGGPYTPVAGSLTSPGFAHAGLTSGVTRYYVVAAENSAGQGPDSAEASATPESPEITAEELRASLLDLSKLPGGSANLTMTIAASVIGHSYRVQFSPDLTAESWEDVGEVHPGTGEELEIVLPLVLTGDKGFYRVFVSR